jgi:hypothetical protein
LGIFLRLNQSKEHEFSFIIVRLNARLAPRITRFVHTQVATYWCSERALLAVDEEDFLLIHPLGEIGCMVESTLSAVDSHSGVGGFSI